MENKYAKYLPLTAIVLFLGSCSSFSPTPEEIQLLKTAEALDQLTEYNEEFGTASISGIRIESPDDGFSFDLNRKAEDYFTEAKAIHQGAVANLNQSAHRQEAALKGQTINSAVTEASSNGATQLNTNDPTASQATSYLTKNKNGNLAYGFGELLADSTLSVSNREAIAIAAGDKAVENIYRLLGSPELAKPFEDKKVLYGAATVSVTPGWRTRKDFAAVVSADVRLTYDLEARREIIERMVNSRKIKMPIGLRYALAGDYRLDTEKFRKEFPDDPGYFGDIPRELNCLVDGSDFCSDNLSPYESCTVTVAAVSPMTETQTLDLANSKRQALERSLEMMAILKANGLDGSAQYIDQYVKSLQRDSKTLSVNSVSNAFSAGNGTFGYHVGPKFKSLDVQSDDDDEANNVLEAQSFPILILMGSDEGDLYPKLIDCKQSNNNEACKKQNHKFVVFEPHLRVYQHAHWSPVTERWYSLGGLFGSIAPVLHHRTEEKDLQEKLLEMHIENNALQKKINELDQESTDNHHLIGLNYHLYSKILIQQAQQLSWLDQAFPIDLIVPPEPQKEELQVTKVTPERIRVVKGAPETVQLVITGEHLEEINWPNVEILPKNADVAELVGRPKSPEIKDKSNVTNHLLNLIVNAKVAGGIAFKLPRKEKDKPSLVTQPINIEVVEAKNELGDIKKDITDLKKDVADLKKTTETKK